MRKLKLQQTFKYRKNHKYFLCSSFVENKGSILQFGNFGLKIIETGNLDFKELESSFKILLRKMKKKGKIFIKGLPFFSMTKKPLEVRMGKGKGNPGVLYLPVRQGLILFELLILRKKFSNIVYIRSILSEISKRLSLKTKIIKNKF